MEPVRDERRFVAPVVKRVENSDSCCSSDKDRVPRQDFRAEPNKTARERRFVASQDIIPSLLICFSRQCENACSLGRSQYIADSFQSAAIQLKSSTSGPAGASVNKPPLALVPYVQVLISVRSQSFPCFVAQNFLPLPNASGRHVCVSPSQTLCTSCISVLVVSSSIFQAPSVYLSHTYPFGCYLGSTRI